IKGVCGNKSCHKKYCCHEKQCNKKNFFHDYGKFVSSACTKVIVQAALVPPLTLVPTMLLATVLSNPPEVAACVSETKFPKPVTEAPCKRCPAHCKTAEVPEPTVLNVAQISNVPVSVAAVCAVKVRAHREVSPTAPAVPKRTLRMGVAVPAAVLETWNIK